MNEHMGMAALRNESRAGKEVRKKERKEEQKEEMEADRCLR